MKIFHSLFSIIFITFLLGCDSSHTGGNNSNNNTVAPKQVAVQVIALNDFHGALKPPGGEGTQGGIEVLGTMIKELKLQNNNTIVVGAGDLIGASPLLSAMFHDEPTIKALGMVGLETTSVGNHEFDKGVEELLRKQYGGCHPVTGCQAGTTFEGATFEYLAANVIVQSSGETLFPSYYIKEFNGIPIAFIGVTLEGTPKIVTPKGTEGLSFIKEATAINALIPELQQKGIKAIGVLIHEGAEQQGESKDINGCENIGGAVLGVVEQLDKEVDFIISGHTHQAYNCMINGRSLTSAQSNGLVITKLDLTLDPVTKEVVSIQAKNLKVDPTEYSKDPELTQFLDDYEAIEQPLANEKIGTLTENIDKTLNNNGDSDLGRVIADALLYSASKSEFGNAQIAFTNSGGIRASLKAGEVTYAEIYAVQPFSNATITLTLTGAQLKQILEQQFDRSTPQVLPVSTGFYYEWDDSLPAGNKVIAESMTLNNAPINMEASYQVAANEFIATGGSGFTGFTEGINSIYGGADNEVLVTYFREKSPISSPQDIRIKKIN